MLVISLIVRIEKRPEGLHWLGGADRLERDTQSLGGMNVSRTTNNKN
jgi:hypothetical protein